jgi:hypothetical protein
MTHDDLATLVRDDVAATEPVHGPDAMVPVRLGRRRLRSRRLATGAAAAVVVAVGAAVAVPLALGDGASGPSRGIDPISQDALDRYDAQRMPQLMDDHVRPVLERSVPDLGPVTFHAGDGQGAAMSPKDYDKASGLSVSYGSDEHSWSVNLLHARSEAEGDPDEYCATGLREGYDLECTVERLPNGDIVFRSLHAIKPFGHDQNGPMWMAVNRDQLETIDPGRLWFERVVKVIKSDTLVTYSHERVHAPTREAAEAAFRVPVADLVEIGTDPVLVMPEPPIDEAGCPWTLDPAVSCVDEPG